jgi:crotonobetainyl-CoA:carnitine CoA-transferase CaiB-like acyl-CoA transferase
MPFGGYFQSINRNKLSIALDLKTEAGKEVLRRLVREADVLVENYRVGVMDRLGLSYESLAKINPKLVYATVRGFGDPRTGKSPYADWPAFDVIAQAMGGIMGITGPDAQTPLKIGPGVGDIVPAMLMTIGILSAVRHAEKTGEGQFVDVGMYDAILALCERIVYQHSYDGTVPGPEGNSHPLLCPFGLFPAKDGWVSIACPRDHFWKILTETMGRPEFGEDERYALNAARVARNAEVVAMVSGWTKTLTKKQLAECLGGQIPFGPVNNVVDIFNDPHTAVREMLPEVEQPGRAPVRIAGTPIRMTKTQGGVARRGALLGEDTDAILRDAGYTADEIAALHSSGAVR